METEFTPLISLAGGLMIGTAAVLLMALKGRIAGATGILTGAVFADGWAERSWRIAFLAGVLSAPIVYLLLFGEAVAIQVPVPLIALVLGGIIVGMGVNWANGCTSGHGVCGMARFSLRSIVATMTFMVVTIATVFVVRHVIGG
ncbi:MAG: YeeE/YedE thiosulfate transporter family protein [Alphaproteobacteria bacterium]|nr:YeeE/YedE thiosulfate transporter family protein [Alphaproteobacteria bacterium]